MEDYTKWESFCITLAGAQPELFKDRDPLHKQGHIKAYQKMIRPVNVVLQMHKVRKHCGRFADIDALKTNDLFCYHGRVGQRGLGRSPRKIFGIMPIPS